MSLAPSLAARILLAVVISVLGTVSARTWAAEDSSFTKESRKPKASRRALLAATTRSTVSWSADEDRDDATSPRPVPPSVPLGRSTHASVRKNGVLVLKTTTPDYLLPYRPSGPAGLLSPPA